MMLRLTTEEKRIFRQVIRYIDENYAPDEMPQKDPFFETFFVDHFIDWRKPKETLRSKNEFCENVLTYFDGDWVRLKACCKKAYPGTRTFEIICQGAFSPTRLAICKMVIAAEFDMERANQLLQISEDSFHSYDKFDVVMMFFLQNKIYSFSTINKILYLIGLPMLSYCFI